MRRLLALLLPLLLLVSACSSGAADPAASDSVVIPPNNAETLASVKVEGQGDAKVPTVTFDKPLDIKAESMKVLTEGDGDQLTDGQVVSFQQVMLNAADGSVLGESFTTQQNNNITLDENFKTQFPMVHETFVSAKVGSYIAYGIPGTPAVAGTATTPAQDATPAQLSVFLVTAAKDAPPPAQLMSADDVAALAKDGKLPTATFNDQGVPSITIPKNDAPADLAVQVLTEGDGEAVAESDTVTFDYVGWTWDGKQFDGTFGTGKPLTIALNQVIEGWTKGLAGQKIGSTVLLTIPTSMAYGENAAAQGRPAGPLVFVVKIEAKN